MKGIRTAWIIALLFVVAACGGDGDGSSNGGTEPAAQTDTTEQEDEQATTTQPEEATGGEDGGDAGDSGNDSLGTATVTVGDETWHFDNLYCFYDPDDDEWDLMLAARDGDIHLAVYRSLPDGTYGDEIEVADLSNLAAPTMSWTTMGWDMEVRFFLNVSGMRVTAEAGFYDNTDEADPFDPPVPGSLDATCVEFG